MNVFDWLSELPLNDIKPFQIVEVSFSKGSRKDYYRNQTGLTLSKGVMITVEGVNGFDVGMVNLTGELVKLQMKKYAVRDTPEIKKVLRKATEEDLEAYYLQKDREPEIMIRSRAIARQLNLDMKIAEVEIQADGRKGTFFYTADGRVDFRELIKVYATEFRLKVEMKQIGARQESGKIGGIGSCGRELCCSTWLSDFKSVNTAAARYQNLSINQTKLSGQCGRLKCCLNYELDTYMDALRVFPTDAETLETATGTAFLQKRDIFKSLMWYGFKGSSKQYPLTIQRVLEIQQLNKEGIKPEEIGAVELEVKAKSETQADKGFVNDVGQISLRSLERQKKKQKQKEKEQKSGSIAKDPSPSPGKEKGNRESPPQPQQKRKPQQQGIQQSQKQKVQQPRQAPPQDPQNTTQQGEAPRDRPRRHHGNKPKHKSDKGNTSPKEQ